MFDSFDSSNEIRHLHVVIAQLRQRNVQKSVMHVQSCSFANIDVLLFCRSRCRRRRRCQDRPGKGSRRRCRSCLSGSLRLIAVDERNLQKQVKVGES